MALETKTFVFDPADWADNQLCRYEADSHSFVPLVPATVTGDRSAGTALDNLLTALATAKIIVDGTVA